MRLRRGTLWRCGPPGEVGAAEVDGERPGRRATRGRVGIGQQCGMCAGLLGAAGSVVVRAAAGGARD